MPLLSADGLRVRYAGQIKPTGVPKIDWGHPLTRGLVFYGFDTGMGLIVDLVYNRPMNAMTGVTTPAKTQSRAYGAGIDYNVSDGRYFLSDSYIQGLSAPLSIASGFYTNQNNASPAQFIFGRLCNNSAQPVVNYGFQLTTASNTANLFINSAGTATATAFTTAIVPFSFETLVGVIPTSATTTLYHNGKTNGSGAGLTFQNNNTNDQITFGARPIATPAAFFGGHVYYGAIWSRALSQDEAEQLHLDPYCFLIQNEFEFPALLLGGDLTLSILGASLISTPGIFIPEFDLAVTGQLTSTGIGSVAPNINVSPVGAAITSGQGLLAAKLTVPLTGQQITTGQGSMSVGSNVNVAITGLSVVTTPGSFAPGLAVAALGLGATTLAGSLAPGLGPTLGGQAVTSRQGTFSLALAIAAIGQSIVGLLGNLSVIPSGFIAALSRTFGIGKQNRTYQVVAQARTYQITAQNRIYIVPDNNRETNV